MTETEWPAGYCWVRRRIDGALLVTQIERPKSGRAFCRFMGNLNSKSLTETRELFEFVQHIEPPRQD
jgi:hypothetical protein